MIFGIILLLLTGLCWAGIAVTVSRAAVRHLDVDFIQFAASVVIAAAGVAVMMLHPVPGMKMDTPLSWILSGAVMLAGSGNFLMINLMRRAMICGNKAAVWAIAQSALICPFLMGMICFDADVTVLRCAGIIFILGGIVLFSAVGPVRRSRRKAVSWLPLAFGAFAASGAAQCLANLPSYWPETAMSGVLRACLVQSGTVGAFICSGFLRGGNRFRRRGTLFPVILLSAVQIASLFFLFYRGLNLVAANGCGSIGYPIAQGSCIAFFLLYNSLIRKERGGWKQVAALSLLLAGILVIGM